MGMAGFLQTLQKRVAGRVLVYSHLGTAMVRGSSISRGCRCGRGLDYTGWEVGRLLDQWGVRVWPKAAGVLERWTMDLESSMNFGVFRCGSLFVGSVSCTFTWFSCFLSFSTTFFISSSSNHHNSEVGLIFSNFCLETESHGTSHLPNGTQLTGKGRIWIQII